MPISAANLFDALNLRCAGSVPWGGSVPEKCSGVYFVSLSERVDDNDGSMATAPICREAVTKWIASVTSMRLDGSTPTVDALIECLQGFWLPDECIVYIGKSTSLRERLGQFVRHRLGERRPHAGGHWLKTLSCLDRLKVYFAICDSAADAEAHEYAALRTFVAQVSNATRNVLANPQLPIPFANREHPRGTRKQRRISHDILG